MNKEFLHMQKLAGLITESEYKQKLNEDVEELTSAEASKKIKDITRDPKFNAEMEKFWTELQSKLPPEDLEKFKQNIISSGVVQETLNEDEYSNAFNIAKSKAEEISENIENTSGATQLAGKIISGVGKVGASMVPAALAASTLGIGAWGLGIGAVMIASLLAGAALWWLGDKIQGK